MVTAGSDRKVWWQCENGHEWQAVIKIRNRGSGCPVCAGKKVSADNSLSSLNPALAVCVNIVVA